MDFSDKIRVIITADSRSFVIDTTRTDYPADIGFNSHIGGPADSISFLPKDAPPQKKLPSLSEIKDIILENLMRSRYITPHPDKVVFEPEKIYNNYANYPYKKIETAYIVLCNHISSVRVEIWEKDSLLQEGIQGWEINQDYPES